eukprot:1159388-Pelagomonas_calceolata.AAC.31
MWGHFTPYTNQGKKDTLAQCKAVNLLHYYFTERDKKDKWKPGRMLAPLVILCNSHNYSRVQAQVTLQAVIFGVTVLGVGLLGAWQKKKESVGVQDHG